MYALILQLLANFTASVSSWQSLIWPSADSTSSLGAVGVIYVNCANTGSVQNGLSWSSAYSSLSDALAGAGDKTTMWIAKGTYYPSTTNDRTDTFSIEYSMGIYGGFEGTETTLNDRKYPLPETILSGDIGVANDDSDNSYHVLTMGSSSATLDGLIIANGNANDETFTTSSKSNNNDNNNNNNDKNDYNNKDNKIKQFKKNMVKGENDHYCKYCFGGGMYIPRVSDAETAHIRYTLTNMTFINNTAYGGGAIFAFTDTVIKIYDSNFTNNNAKIGTYHDGLGGAIYTVYNGVLEVYDSIFEYNKASAMGGAIMIDYGSTAVIRRDTFKYNKAVKGNGGAIAAYDRDSQFSTGTIVTVNGCKFDYNYADNGYGGAIWLYDGPVGHIYNSSFSYNSAVSGGAIALYYVTCVDCCKSFTNTFVGNTGETANCLVSLFPSIDDAPALTDSEALTYLETLYDQRNDPSYESRKSADRVIYVNGKLEASGDCLSWSNACVTIQEALEIGQIYTELDERIELWVVGGNDVIYYPTTVPSWYNTSASYYNKQKSRLIEVYSNIAMFGGFDGSETNRRQRNWYENPTYIDGELNKNNKVYQVMYLHDGSWIDGFLIRNGYALVKASSDTLDNDENDNDENNDNRKASELIIDSRNNKNKNDGKMERTKELTMHKVKEHFENMWNDMNSLTNFVNDKVVEPTKSKVKHLLGMNNNQNSNKNNNKGNKYGSTNPNDVLYSKDPTKGGGLFINATATIVNCLIYSNFGMKGGGIYILGNDNEDHSATVINTGLINNAASVRGGAISIDLYGYLDCDYCTISNNKCRFKGGGVYSDFDAASQFNHTSFINNTAYDGGGAIAVDGAGYSVMENVNLKDNSAFSEGAAIYAGSYDPFDNQPNFLKLNKSSVVFENNHCDSGGNNYFMWTYDYIEYD